MTSEELKKEALGFFANHVLAVKGTESEHFYHIIDCMVRAAVMDATDNILSMVQKNALNIRGLIKGGEMNYCPVCKNVHEGSGCHAPVTLDVKTTFTGLDPIEPLSNPFGYESAALYKINEICEKLNIIIVWVNGEVNNKDR